MSEKNQEDKTHEEFLVILDAFRRMVYNYENSAERWDVFDDIISSRASFLIDRVMTGLRMDFDTALERLQDKNIHLTEREQLERDTLVTAIDNLVDFAAAEETAMMDELPGELDISEMETYESVCRKYNETYADAENAQVLHSALIAAWWMGVSEESVITYNTQNDERVRAWHQSYDGVSYPKNAFPPELIPPIEWGCRCFLTSNGYGSIMDSVLKPGFKGKINPVFAESLATGGRIFSEAHPYFFKPLPAEVEMIKQRIKRKFTIV